MLCGLAKDLLENLKQDSHKILSKKILYRSLVHWISWSDRVSKSIKLQSLRFFLETLSGTLMELIRSNTMLVATACTLLFCWSDRMSWTLTSQSILSNTNTNVLPSFNSCTARSKKCFPISSWTVYFIDFERHTPYLCNLTTSWKGIETRKITIKDYN